MAAPPIPPGGIRQRKGEAPTKTNPPESECRPSFDPFPLPPPLSCSIYLCLRTPTRHRHRRCWFVVFLLGGWGEMAAAGGGDVAGGGIGALPEECISHVLSLTSPRDACRSAAVSSAFLAAGESDLVWGRFLPPDCGDVLAPSAEAEKSSRVFASKKELYLRLCDSVPIDGGKKIFALERSTGRKCYTLSARDLVIVWGDTPHYWRWISLPESRFADVAELLDVCWLEIHGKIHSRMLSPKTTYAAYLLFKLADNSQGLSFPNQEGTIKVGSHTSKEAVCLHPLEWQAHWRGPIVRFRRTLFRPPPPPSSVDEQKRRVPCPRGDGWMEILIGEFFIDEGDDGEVDISLMETQGGHWKSGLIVEAIEIRPKTLKRGSDFDGQMIKRELLYMKDVREPCSD